MKLGRIDTSEPIATAVKRSRTAKGETKGSTTPDERSQKKVVAGGSSGSGTSGLRAGRKPVAPQPAGRRSPQKESFAYLDKRGVGHLPLNDETQVRSAMAHWNLTEFDSASARETARQTIVEAAHHYGIHVLPNRKIARPAVGLSPRR